MSGRSFSHTKHMLLAIHEDQLKRNGGMQEFATKGFLIRPSSACLFLSEDKIFILPCMRKRLDTATGSSRTTFDDGNKRTGTALIIAFLHGNGVKFKPRTQDFFDTVIAVANGTMSYDELVAWIEKQI